MVVIAALRGTADLQHAIGQIFQHAVGTPDG